MTNIHHSRHVSTWIIDAYHSGIVYDHRPGEFRYLVETRRAVEHTADESPNHSSPPAPLQVGFVLRVLRRHLFGGSTPIAKNIARTAARSVLKDFADVCRIARPIRVSTR